MNLLRLLLVIMLSSTVAFGPSSAAAAAPSPGPSAGEAGSPVPSREGDALDRFTSVAAVVGIVLVGAAGLYIYGLIRKGL